MRLAGTLDTWGSPHLQLVERNTCRCQPTSACLRRRSCIETQLLFIPGLVLGKDSESLASVDRSSIRANLSCWLVMSSSQIHSRKTVTSSGVWSVEIIMPPYDSGLGNSNLANLCGRSLPRAPSLASTDAASRAPTLPAPPCQGGTAPPWAR